MSYECRRLAVIVNQIGSSEAGAEQLRALMDEGAPAQSFAEVIAAHCRPDLAEVVQAEFAELPRSFISTWLISWRLAADCGQSFEMISEPAPRPLEYAKAGRVAYRIEHDNEGVRMYVSHVHGHHAEWFKPELEAAAAV